MLKPRENLKVRQDIRKRKVIKLKIKIKMSNHNHHNQNELKSLKELLQRPFIKQRSAEWYKLREDRLTASDLYDAIKNPLALAKRKLKGTSYNSGSVPALKWGTMFEAMAIRNYSHLKQKKIHEFGLIINDEISDFGASPDGITEDGIMIEIKCPFSRKIVDGTIPEKYYYQMQGQLAVCKLNNCDYIECEFITFQNEEEYLANCDNSNDNYLHGIIAEKKENGEFIYHYSTENQDCMTNINEMNSFNGYNFIYWKLKSINIQQVVFNKEKWDNFIVDKINNYTTIYKQEKNFSKNPANLFINDDD